MNKLLVGILFVFLIISFATLPRNPLQNDDAATYAVAAKNAILYNQWLVQLVTPGDLSSFLDKPPLGIWLLAWFPKIVGINELSIHFPNVIYYCFLLLLLYVFISKSTSRRAALYPVLIASTSLALVAYSRTPKLEIMLAFFVMAAHFSLFTFLKRNNAAYLYLFVLFCGLGFLVKTGLSLLFPALTALSLMVVNKEARRKLLKFSFSPHSILCLLLFLAIIGTILGAQSFVLKDQWPPYLKSIFIQSKYNSVPILGFGFYYSIISLLLIAIFPWTPLFFSGCARSLRIKKHFASLSLSRFCVYWFWSNFLFLLFFYRQTDFRTFVALVPPMAILAGIRLRALQIYSRKRIAEILWNIFFLTVFSAALIILLVRPYNAQGINVSAAILPIFMFVISLLALTFYLWKPSAQKFAASFLLICISYGILFYNTKPLVDAFNDDVTWPNIIKDHRIKGSKFCIYRPPDRNLSFSPDLLYVDFIIGPADKYFWNRDALLKSLKTEKAIILSDTKSWEKLNSKTGKIIAQDNYSSLILCQ